MFLFQMSYICSCLRKKNHLRHLCSLFNKKLPPSNLLPRFQIVSRFDFSIHSVYLGA
jgi:hypothetical protein